MTVDKTTIITTLILLLSLIAMMIFVTSLSEVSSDNKIKEQESYNKICEDLDLELLSISKELFSEDYVICYNE